jgi:hypothetical protein
MLRQRFSSWINNKIFYAKDRRNFLATKLEKTAAGTAHIRSQEGRGYPSRGPMLQQEDKRPLQSLQISKACKGDGPLQQQIKTEAASSRNLHAITSRVSV